MRRVTVPRSRSRPGLIQRYETAFRGRSIRVRSPGEREAGVRAGSESRLMRGGRPVIRITPPRARPEARDAYRDRPSVIRVERPSARTTGPVDKSRLIRGDARGRANAGVESDRRSEVAGSFRQPTGESARGVASSGTRPRVIRVQPPSQRGSGGLGVKRTQAGDAPGAGSRSGGEVSEVRRAFRQPSPRVARRGDGTAASTLGAGREERASEIVDAFRSAPRLPDDGRDREVIGIWPRHPHDRFGFGHGFHPFGLRHHGFGAFDPLGHHGFFGHGFFHHGRFFGHGFHKFGFHLGFPHLHFGHHHSFDYPFFWDPFFFGDPFFFFGYPTYFLGVSAVYDPALPVVDPAPAMVRPISRTVGPTPVVGCVAVYVRTTEGTEHQVAVRPERLGSTVEAAAQTLEDRLLAGEPLRLDLLDGTTLTVPAVIVEQIEVRSCGQPEE